LKSLLYLQCLRCPPRRFPLKAYPVAAAVRRCQFFFGILWETKAVALQAI
jgi:hypothetical protein